MLPDRILGVGVDSNVEGVDAFVPLVGLKNAHAFDYDSKLGRLYWTEVSLILLYHHNIS